VGRGTAGGGTGSRLRFGDAIASALGMIRAQKLKSFFSLLGIVIGVTSLVAVISIVAGMDRYVREDFAGKVFGVNTFTLRRRSAVVFSRPDDETIREWRRRPRLRVEDYRYLRDRVQVPAIMTAESSDMATVRHGSRIAPGIQIVAADADYFRIRAYEIEIGRAFTQTESDLGRPVVVVGSEIADKLLDPGDPIGQALHIGGTRFTVIGVIKSQGSIFGLSLDKFVVAPWTSAASRIVNPPRLLDAITVKAGSDGEMRDAMNEVEALMRNRRHLRPSEQNNFGIETSAGILDAWKTISKILFAALPGLVGISLVVSGIVIMNIMLIAVAERTREIGIRRSIGARRRDILVQFLLEAGTLSGIGGTVGILLGVAIAKIVQATTPLPAAVSPLTIAAGLLLGCGVGVASGLYPAWRAAKLDPIEALRQET
jgi:putative ABC transport system permease protein